MGEIKSVKVDNWGVFFLQKLQNFFNKTDYCDLTLQFRDNSQLKVHRLVLSACTDYFNVLEQTCEVIDDALIMPNELQADVVVPIVNFMYTGTLEFELKMYGKLLRTAKEMNMTVLLKLLEAHRRTMENANRSQRPPSPKAIRRRHPMATQTTTLPTYQNQTGQVRRVLTTNVAGGIGANANTTQRRIVQTKIAGTTVTPVQMQYRQQIGSTSVVRTSTVRGNNPQQQQTIQTYIKNEPEEYETFGGNQPQSSSSPFEQLRKGYNNNKRPAVSTFLSPPSKKPNLEDVKEFAEQQRMRKQIAAEYGEDQEFEGMLDDDIRNDDDDDDALLGNPVQSSTMNTATTTGAATSVQANDGAAATITFKHESDGQPPTIIVKDNSGSKMDHAKIISEVLRQYPQLAKGNRNIKLKIMPTGQGQAQRIIIKKEGVAGESQQQATNVQPQQQQQPAMKQLSQKPIQQALRAAPSHMITKSGERVALQQIQTETTAANKPTVTITQQTLITPASNIAAAAATTVASTSASTENPQQKRRIDSKTMHALIALGAENMAGPWLCLRCGVNGRPISIPTYRGFRRHLINTHKETIDPALCEHCGWRSENNRELHFHIQIEHKIKTTLYTFPECLLCAELFLDTNALNQHMLDSHPSANKQQCIYCNKIFIKDMQLYTHLKLYHKHQAVEDGIIDASEEEYAAGSQIDADGDNDADADDDMNEGIEEHLENEDETSKDKKVKILSDISLPMTTTTTSSIIKLDGNTLTADSTVINAQTKFVTADGNEMLLTDEQRKEIMSQLNQEHNNAGGVVMVLNDAIFTGTDGGGGAGDAAPVTEHEELDDSQIYSELASEKAEEENHQQQQQHDEAKETAESLEWAENLISEHEMAENKNGGAAKIEEDKAKKELISKKLKELTVDWSEDENEEDDEDLDKSGQTEETSETNKLEEKVQDEIESQGETEVGAEAETEKQTTELDVNEDALTDSQDKNMEEKEEEISQSERKVDENEEEQDELDLAMQNLHEENENETETITEKTTAAEVATAKEVEEEVEKMDTDETLTEEENKADEKDLENPTENQENSLNSTLLNELMSESVAAAASTAEQQQETAVIADIEKALNENDDDEKNVEPKTEKSENELDAFAKAGLNDVEEFSTIEKNLETTNEEEEEATASKETTENIEKNEEQQSQVDEKQTVEEIAKGKTSSSDWEDIEDDDGGLEDEQN